MNQLPAVPAENGADPDPMPENLILAFSRAIERTHLAAGAAVATATVLGDAADKVDDPELDRLVGELVRLTVKADRIITEAAHTLEPLQEYLSGASLPQPEEVT